jgi:hypothetical protein
MLKRLKQSQAVSAEASLDHGRALRGLHSDLRTATDEKIRQIVGLLDVASDHHEVHALLDPLRPRLAVMRPSRPLRFSRLLFIPLADLLILPRLWKPGQASIPRNALKSIANSVRAGLGGDVEPIDSMIAGHSDNELDVVALAGGRLWRKAGDLLADGPTPADWAETGLSAAAYPLIARGAAAVLRRALSLQALRRQSELGALQPDERTVGDIIAGIENESTEGRVLVLKLILANYPHAGRLLRQLVGLAESPAAKAMFQQALAAGAEGLLREIETAPALVGNLDQIANQVQRLTTLVQDLEHDEESPRQRARLRAVQSKLDGLCRGRFVESMQENVLLPLADSSAPFDAAGQRELESCARDLRTVETVGRKLGSAPIYDASLAQAGAAVEAAADAGTLTHMRAVRLVEILSGPEQAERLYRRTMVQPGAARSGHLSQSGALS